MADKIKILLVDDHAIVTDGLVALLGNEEDFVVIEKHNSANYALAWLKTNDADILVTDYSMPDMSGVLLVKEVKRLKPSLKILVLSMHDETPMIKDMLNAGVDGYILKKYAHDELIKAIKEIAYGRNFWSEEVHKVMYYPSNQEELTTNHVTDREIDVLKLIVKELTSKEIAEILFISERTVETHRKNLMRKTGVNNVIGLVKYAYSHKLI